MMVAFKLISKELSNVCIRSDLVSFFSYTMRNSRLLGIMSTIL